MPSSANIETITSNTCDTVYSNGLVYSLNQCVCCISLQAYYYFAMVEDLILRFTWILSVTVGEMGFLHPEILKSILAPLEVFR